MSVEQRLLKLERDKGGDGGKGVVGVCRADAVSGTGPDVVTVAATGETLTTAAFSRRYPLGLLVVRTVYGSSCGPGRAGDGQGVR